MKFKRNINVSGVLFASVGAMIGSGWLFGALYAAQMAGPAAILSWLIGAFFVVVIGLAIAELVTMFPISGGMSIYPYFTHGNFVGFIFGWVSWLSFVVLPPIEVLAVLQYSSNYIPGLSEKIGKEQHLTSAGLCVAAVLLLLLVYINSVGSRFMAETNKFLTFWKLSVPFLVIVIFLFSCNNGTENLFQAPGGFAPYGIQGVLSALAIGGVVFSFNGFQAGVMLAGEAKNAQKTVPIAIIGSIIICALLYGVLQIAFLLAVPSSSLANGWASLSFSGDAGPLAGLALMLGIVWLASLLYIDAVVAPFGAGIVYTASASRVLYAMGASGSIPPFLMKMTKGGVPLISLIINFIVGIVMFFPFPGWDSMMAFLSSAFVLSLCVGPLCLVSLRKQAPEHQRGFRLPKYKIFAFIAFYFANLMLYWTGWNVIWKLSIAVVIGCVLFTLQIVNGNNSRIKRVDLKPSVWLVPYFIGFLTISYFGSYGGGLNKITVGWDFAAIALFSFIIFHLSQIFALEPSKAKEYINKTLSKHQATDEFISKKPI
ncbi:MAG: APC family permease, partial [Silvanigrellaceae bacterium]|nr:APC family permease [Silvanigrellaceae bacterium]